MRFLVLIVFGLFTVNALSDQVLHFSDTCKKEYIEDLHTLNTKDASLYAYYHYIASGGCLDVDLKDEGRFDRINQHFAKLGNYSAYVRLSNDYQNVVEKAESGDIDARALIVMANAVQQTAHYSRTKKLDELNLTSEDKARYVDEILDLANKGDIRVLQSALTYLLWQPTKLEGDDPSATSGQDRINKANDLVKKYGDTYSWLQMLHNSWLLGSKDFSWCVEERLVSEYRSIIDRHLNEFSRPLLCSSEFDKSEFKKVGKLSDYERILYFKRILEPRSLQSPSGLKEKKKWLLDWNDALNKLGYLAYYGVPFAKETISFLLIELPYSPGRDLQGLNWLSSVKPSKLERLVSSRFGKNMYDSKLSFDVQGIPSIPSSAKYYAISFLYTNQAHLYYDLTVKNVLPLGDLLSFYTFYLVFSSEESLDEKIAWAAITVLELHSPNTAHSLKQDFQRSKLTQPSDSQVDKIIKEWSPYLPKPGEGKFIYARFDSDIKPYVLSELAMKLKKLEAN